MNNLLYDDKNIKSIVEYAQKLENKTIEQVNSEQKSFAGKVEKNKTNKIVQNNNNKGGFGNYLESAYFGKENDNKSQPDFPEAKLELKASPLKTISNYDIRVKERLVLNHFTYFDLVKEEFETSHLKYKNENLLLVFYKYEKNKPYGQIEISLADLWQCFKEDEFQIKQDWNTIVQKIKNGKAHEISEGDTLYLGACTKGSTAESSMQNQPFSEIKARGRAFCFKLSYINHIYQILLQRKNHRKELETRLLSNNQSLESKISELFTPYLKKTASEICILRGKKYNPKDKSRYANIARSIVGLKKDGLNIYEFNAADIQFKTIRVEPNGKFIESISFKQIDYCEIIDEEWEDSYFYNAITSKFIFVLFKRDSTAEDYYLDKVVFWQIPTEDYHFFEEVWTDTRDKIRKGDYSNFIKMSENPISHIRPHASNAEDVMCTPQGTYEKKKCFWISKNYIQEKLLNQIYKN